MSIDLKKAREICGAAGPWPWIASNTNVLGYHSLNGVSFEDGSSVISPSESNREENCRFIAFARTALPEALDEIENLLDKLDRATRLIEMIDARYLECHDDCARYDRPCHSKPCNCGGERLRKALADWRDDND